MAVYLFDGSFEGLLTAIFEYYDRKAAVVTLWRKSDYVHTLLPEEILEVITDTPKAQRVWIGLKKKLSPDTLHKFYCAYLSEQKEMMNHLFSFACCVFNTPDGFEYNYANEHVLAITQMDKKVNREKHRMKAFIRFRKSNDGLYFSIIKPDFNVLPLIYKHFKNRYADQRWLIYDEQRAYGIYYDLETVTQVTIDFRPDSDNANELTVAVLDADEELYNQLWKDYFTHTNIVSRRNMKLHIQHVPKRYWRYLTEKQM